MNENEYNAQVKKLLADHKVLIERPNDKTPDTNGIVLIP
jgi:hypothetical protein